MIKNTLKNLVRRWGRLCNLDLQDNLERIRHEIEVSNNILIDDYIQKNLFDDPRYADPKKLNRYEFQYFSQHGEDGMIQEIFRRIGTTNRFFVEFGIGDGNIANTTFLLLLGWQGCWLEGKEQYVRSIQEQFKFLIDQNKLKVKQAFIYAENIEDLLGSLSCPKEPDLLTIDIDGNDYWVWKAIQNYRPRVVVLEYNAIFRPPVEFVVKYEPNKVFPITSHFGASLKSFELLGREKGYCLVGSNFTGVNTFLVREDLVKDKFLEPFTAEVHYEPPRYYLYRKFGHTRRVGEWCAWLESNQQPRR